MYLKNIPGKNNILFLPTLIIIVLGLIANNVIQFSHQLEQFSLPFTHEAQLSHSFDTSKNNVLEELDKIPQIATFKIHNENSNNLSVYIKTNASNIDALLTNNETFTLNQIQSIEPLQHTFMTTIKYIIYLFILLLFGLILSTTHHFLKYNIKTFETILLLGNTKYNLIKKVGWYFFKQYVLGSILGSIILLSGIVFITQNYTSQQVFLSFIQTIESIVMFTCIPIITVVTATFVSILITRRIIYKL